MDILGIPSYNISLGLNLEFKSDVDTFLNLTIFDQEVPVKFKKARMGPVFIKGGL